MGRSQNFADSHNRGADCHVAVLEFLFWFSMNQCLSVEGEFLA